MNKRTLILTGTLLILSLLGGCSSTPATIATPETSPGDQLQSEYMYGNWCTNREDTSKRNQDANFSAMTNLSMQFWQLTSDGKWGTSSSGWVFNDQGSWKLDGRNTLQLTQSGAGVLRYQAHFANGGKDMVLQSEAGDFLVMDRCE